MSKLYFIIFFILCNLTTFAQQSIHPFLWLEGVWQIGNKTEYEVWKYSNDTLLQGVSFKVNNNDTSIAETMQIITHKTFSEYVVKVPGQNNDEAVAFKTLKADTNQWIFTNYDHDFPQFISYNKTDALHLRADVKGEENGEKIYIPFYMTKIENYEFGKPQSLALYLENGNNVFNDYQFLSTIIDHTDSCQQKVYAVLKPYNQSDAEHILNELTIKYPNLRFSLVHPELLCH